MKPNAMAISTALQKFDFQRVLDDFRHMNPNDPGSWQLVPRVAVLCGVFFLILVLGWWFVWSDQLTDLGSKENEERTLKEQFVEKKRQAVNLDLYTQQLAEIDRSFGALLKQLPNKSEIEALLIEVNQAGLGRGLQFELFRPSQELVKDFYAEMPIVVKVNGGYHDFGAFAADIGKLPRIVTLNNLSIAPLKDGGSLTMDATIKTFRYLDDEEIAKQKKITDAKKAAQGAKK
jgi:type IV pilus assembly protein PilO